MAGARTESFWRTLFGGDQRELFGGMCLAMKMPERGADGALILPSATGAAALSSGTSAADLPSRTSAPDDKTTAWLLDEHEPDLTTESGASVADVVDTPHTLHTQNTGSFRPHVLVV